VGSRGNAEAVRRGTASKRNKPVKKQAFKPNRLAKEKRAGPEALL
jgi:hypothetical protein